MPYLAKVDKKRIWKGGSVQLNELKSKGDFNFAVTMLMKAYWEKFGPNYNTIDEIIGAIDLVKVDQFIHPDNPLKIRSEDNKEIHSTYIDTKKDLAFAIMFMIDQYCTLHCTDEENDLFGTLTCAQNEFYMRIASLYEKEKILINGDVYVKET